MNKKNIVLFALILIIIICIITLFVVIQCKKSFTVNDSDTQPTESIISTESIGTELISNKDNNIEKPISNEEMEVIASVREENKKLSSINKLDFADAIGDVAIACYSDTKILPSFVVAYAIYQSSWGIADVTEINNYFYLEYKKGCGTKYKIYNYQADGDLSTSEQTSETYAYRAYDTLEEGILDFEHYLLDNYPEIEGKTDYYKICSIVDEKASDAIVLLIEQYGFDIRYDVPAINMTN